MNEVDWQAEEDGRTLMRAEQIKSDPRRLQRARAALDKLAEEKREEAKAAAAAKGRVRATQPAPTKQGSNTRSTAKQEVPGTSVKGGGGFSGSML